MKKIIWFLIVVISFIGLYQKIYIQLPLQADEYQWVGRAYFLDYFLTNSYDKEITASDYNYDQPKLIYYIYGSVLYPGYIIDNKKSGGSRSFTEYLEEHGLFQGLSSKTPSWNKISIFFQNQAQPYLAKNYSTCTEIFCKSIPLIYKARTVSLLFTALSAGFIFLILFKLTKSTILSLLASFYWGTNFIIAKWGLIAMAEGIFIFFFTLGLYLLFIYSSNQKLRGNKKFLIFLGLAFSLAFSTKIHGIILLMILLLYELIQIIMHLTTKKPQLRRFKHKLKNLVIITLSFFIFSIALNPFLWKNPAGSTVKLYSHRLQVVSIQQKDYPESSLDTPIIRVKRLYQHFFYNTSETADFGKLIFNINIPSFVRTLLASIGFYSLLNKKRKNDLSKMLVSLLLAELLVFAFMLKLDWERYYNIFVLPYILLMTLGLKFILDKIPLANSFLKQRTTT